jgi:S-adenosylmethionine:tRNA ribosyltransferase-isomerase
MALAELSFTTFKNKPSAHPVSLFTNDYDYALPEELIARHPAPRREQSRMLVIHRAEQRIEHRQFTDFPALIGPDSLVVLNDTKVIPARVYSLNGRIELLFLEAVGENTWKCMVRPGRRMRVGQQVEIPGAKGRVVDICPDGERILHFDAPVDLDRAGELPLPPYFSRQPQAVDSDRYQTVYAKERGAVAAPTAGLHFTPEILAQIPHTFVTLHVGVGTFRPVQADIVTEHRMHSERYSILPNAAEAMNAAKRLVAIGTTTTRVLESCGRPLHPHQGATDIFIYPGYRFRAVDALLTNFHLPKSTLLMLVSAMVGRELTLRAYAEAVKERYRFYSYGDCMLIL